MNNMEIQKEAIVEIVGTQYEGRAANHKNLALNQKLILNRQPDNIHDSNAIMVLTEDGKELGYMPKGYASLYAPAIDNKESIFSVEIVKTEFDSERPILIIKITAGLSNCNEDDIEKQLIAFVQNIANGYLQRKNEYLQFISIADVNISELISILNKTRLIHKLYSISEDIISKNNIVPIEGKFSPLTREALLSTIKALQSDVGTALKKIQREYNASLDIDDEEEFHKVQGKIREQRKKFRVFDELCTSYYDAVSNYSPVELNGKASDKVVDEIPKTISVSETSNPINIDDDSKPNETPQYPFSEDKFLEWLIHDGNVAEITAKHYVSNIHSIEKLYQSLFGIRKNMFEITSSEHIKAIIESLVRKDEFIDANERRHNSFSASLNKFAQFANVTIDDSDSKIQQARIERPEIINKSNYNVIKIVDLDVPNEYSYYKPSSFYFNDTKYEADNWRDVYYKFLILLYTDSNYSTHLKALVNRAIYGKRIDFADKLSVGELRRPIRVSTDFFAEGNLSAPDILKRIKYIMDICSIGKEQLIIEYYDKEKSELSHRFSEDKQTSTTKQEDSQVMITERSFEKWVIITYSHSLAIAQNHIRTLHLIENLYVSIFSKSMSFFGLVSLDILKKNIESLISKEEYIKTNKDCSNDMNDSLNKYCSYAGLSVDFEISHEPNQLSFIEEDTKEEEQFPLIFGVQENNKVQSSNDAANTQDNMTAQIEIDDTDSDNSIEDTFSPNISVPFELKNAVIEILLSSATDINSYRKYNNGITSKGLCELISKYYDRNVGFFEISKLLMLDKTFKSVGKGCYALANPESFKNQEENVTISVESTIEKQSEAETAQNNTSNTETVEVVQSYNPVQTVTSTTNEDLTASIIGIIKDNSDNIQYEDGFGAYEIKMLLAQQGIAEVSEDEIEKIMSACDNLTEIEEGYYTLADTFDINNGFIENKTTEPEVEYQPDSDHKLTDEFTSSYEVNTADSRRIVLSFDGEINRAYDYADALKKICEFAIICKPFKMARIAGEKLIHNEGLVFYRKAVPVDEYIKLSNGLQLMPISNYSDLKNITKMVLDYCQISDDLITIISK